MHVIKARYLLWEAVMVFYSARQSSTEYNAAYHNSPLWEASEYLYSLQMQYLAGVCVARVMDTKRVMVTCALETVGLPSYYCFW